MVRRYKPIKLLMISIVVAVAVAATACGAKKETSGKEAPSSVGQQVDYKIIGIEPGTGIMDNTETSIETYQLGENWTVVNGSETAMVAALKKALDQKEPIIVTGWQPHWMFTKYPVKFLDDPKNVYGEGNNVHTLVRKNLQQDLPGAYKLLDQFAWELSEQEEVMVKMAEGMKPEEAAKTWAVDHPDRIKTWTDGVTKGNGEKVTIAYAAWADTIASTNIVAHMLTELGYQAELRQVDIGAMYAGIAGGSADALLGSWMPAQKIYYDKFKGQFDDLGSSSKGTRIGLVVPEYMEIDSINDLRNE